MAHRYDGSFVSLPNVPSNARENIKLRGINRLVFTEKDKTYFVYSPAPFHYEEDGELIPYDLRWNEEASTTCFQLYSSDQIVYVSKTLEDALINCERDEYILRLYPISLSDISKTTIINATDTIPYAEEDKSNGHNKSGRIIFPEMFGVDTQLYVRAKERGFNKELQINNSDYLTAFTGETLCFLWKLETSATIYVDNELWNQTETTCEDITFKNENKTLWYFPKPNAWDSDKGDFDGQYKIYVENGFMYIEIQFSLDELKQAVYPIFLDPSYTSLNTDGYINGDGATFALARDTADMSSAVLDYMFVGTRVNAGTYSCWRGYISFDTSDINDEYTIEDSKLTLVSTQDLSTTDFSIYIKYHTWLGDWGLNLEADYDGAIAEADYVLWRSTSGMAINTQYTANLDNDYINKTGLTKFSIVSKNDNDNVAPANWEYCKIASSRHATASYRPTLTLTAYLKYYKYHAFVNIEASKNIKKYVITYKTDNYGECQVKFDGYEHENITGCIDRVIHIPSYEIPPDTNFTVTLEGDLQQDYLQSLCLSFSAEEMQTAYIYPTENNISFEQVYIAEPTTLVITNGGYRREGTIVLVVRENVPLTKTQLTYLDYHIDVELHEPKHNQYLTAFEDTNGNVTWQNLYHTTSITKVIHSVTASENEPILFAHEDIQIISVYAITDLGSVTFNLEHKSKYSAFSSGSSILIDNLIADDNGEETTIFSDNTIKQDDIINIVTSAVVDATKLLVVVTYKIV